MSQIDAANRLNLAVGALIAANRKLSSASNAYFRAKANAQAAATAGVASPLRESVAAPATFPVRIARVAGEAFDADQYGWSCEDCGRDEYGCECELPDNDWPALTDFPGGAKLTIEEVQDRIARVFMGVSR